jgi:hypothetical protein
MAATSTGKLVCIMYGGVAAARPVERLPTKFVVVRIHSDRSINGEG